METEMKEERISTAAINRETRRDPVGKRTKWGQILEIC
jgi:hypothetical protein